MPTPAHSQPPAAESDYLPLAVMACPQHAGKHPFHDQRWIVTAGTEIEHGYDPRPDQWTTRNGSLVAEMRDVTPGMAAFIVRACNSHAALVAALEKDIRHITQLAGMVNNFAEKLGLGRKVRVEDFTENARAALATARQ